jgi:flavoprotein
MTGTRRRPVLYVIACGGHPAADLPAFITWAQHQDWDPCVITTPVGTRFVDVPRLVGLTGYPVRDDFKRPGDADVLPFPPDAFVVAPATFNTINKWANGISDTLALGLLNEGLAAGQPIAAVPNPNSTLAKHPAFARSVAFLRENGVRVLFNPDIYPLPTPNIGEASRDVFPWEALKSVVEAIREEVHLPTVLYQRADRMSIATTASSCGSRWRAAVSLAGL